MHGEYHRNMAAFHPIACPTTGPVVGKTVVVSAIEVPTKNGSEIVRKVCSNSGECIAKHESLEKIPGCCLLHGLRPPV